MEHEKYQSHITKPILAGVLAGYIVTIANIFFDVIFRNATEFPLHELINVSTIIFATLFVLLMAGFLYAFFDRFFKNGTVIYIIITGVFTLACIYWTSQTHRSVIPQVNTEFHQLLIGLIALTGVTATFLLPYLIKHDKMYMEAD